MLKSSEEQLPSPEDPLLRGIFLILLTGIGFYVCVGPDVKMMSVMTVKLAGCLFSGKQVTFWQHASQVTGIVEDVF